MLTGCADAASSAHGPASSGVVPRSMSSARPASSGTPARELRRWSISSIRAAYDDLAPRVGLWWRPPPVVAGEGPAARRMSTSSPPRIRALAAYPPGVTPRELRLILCPFHNGLRGVGMGVGAERLAGDAGLSAGIEGAGWRVTRASVDPVDESDAEVARVVELMRRLAVAVRQAVADGAFPLVLAGNCNSALGTVAGAGADDLAVAWFDAHADFDDPDENLSGFFDVMALAMLTGRGWRALRETIPGHRPLPEAEVVLAAVRDLEPYQRERLEGSAGKVVPGALNVERFDEAMAGLAARRLYLHVDLDSLDPAEGRANPYAAAGGPSLERLLACIHLAGDRVPLAAAAITAYEPACDGDDRVLAA